MEGDETPLLYYAALVAALIASLLLRGVAGG